MQQIQAAVCLPTRDLTGDLTFFTDVLGLRLDEIFPADDPAVAVLSGHGLRVRIDRDLTQAPGTVRISCDAAASFANGETALTSPGGTSVQIVQAMSAAVIPETVHRFMVRRLADQAPWVIGRAGMQYRDLIPDRLGGSIIASHIRIPDGGPVPDMVHYHTVGFQLIFCYRGWVDLVYEDQGEAFRLCAGNCVIQPPKIRHRVLYASDDIEVIEIGVPAEHVTTIDHDMTLPNGPANPDRLFEGQRFVHHLAEGAPWQPFRVPGFQSRDTTIAEHTNAVAGVHVVRPDGSAPEWTRHAGDILFNFVLEGEMTLEAEGHPQTRVTAGDAFVIPPDFPTLYSGASDDLALLEVALPGAFETERLGSLSRDHAPR